jgi:putative salt-induced outer membrane protein
MMSKAWRWSALLVTVLLATVPAWAQDDEEPAKNWSEEAEFSYVMTSGNSDTNTLGFKSKTTFEWTKSQFILRLGAIRGESQVGSRVAVGTPGDFWVTDPDTELTAENYYVDGRYERKITDKFYWYAGAGWMRNRFAGIENRSQLQGGVGNIWYDKERLKWKTDYAVTYTDQEDVVQIENNSFAGLRVTSDLTVLIGKNTTYENDFLFDYDLETSENWHFNMLNALTVSMSKTLALKVGLQWIYFNDPALGVLPV